MNIHKIRPLDSSCFLTGTVYGYTSFEGAYVRIENTGNNSAQNVTVSLSSSNPTNFMITATIAAPVCPLSIVSSSATKTTLKSIDPKCYVDLSIQVVNGSTIYGTIQTETLNLGSSTFSGAVTNCPYNHPYCQ